MASMKTRLTKTAVAAAICAATTFMPATVALAQTSTPSPSPTPASPSATATPPSSPAEAASQTEATPTSAPAEATSQTEATPASSQVEAGSSPAEVTPANSQAEAASYQAQAPSSSAPKAVDPMDEFAARAPYLGKATGGKARYGEATYRQHEHGILVQRGNDFYTIFGGVYTRWKTDGGLGVLGLPKTGEIPASGGIYQVFDRRVMTWHPSYGEFSILGGVRDLWEKEGGPTGHLGLATSSETHHAGGIYQTFQGGTITWHPQHGTRMVRGGVGWLYDQRRYVGVATSAEMAVGEGAYQEFTNGTIAWHPRLGTHVIFGAIRQSWYAWGGVNGLGYPLTPEIPAGGGVYQIFQGGTFYWTPGGGVQTVRGGIGDRYLADGGPDSWRGLPVSPETCIQHSCVQYFEHAAITWNAATGARPQVIDQRCTWGRVACADKTTNQLYWVVDGRIIRTMDARFGRPGMDTSEGEFPLLRKIRMDWSVPYSGWMPFSLYFTNWGEAIHHSSDFERDGHPSLGSHGCINMASWEDSEWLFDQMQFGDRIVVYRS